MTQRDGRHNNEWQWDSVKIELTNPNGKTIKLNSSKLVIGLWNNVSKNYKTM